MDQGSSVLTKEALIAEIEDEKLMNPEYLNAIIGKPINDEKVIQSPEENKSSADILKDIFGPDLSSLEFESNSEEFLYRPVKPMESVEPLNTVKTTQEYDLSEGEINSEVSDASFKNETANETPILKKSHKKKKKKKEKSSKVHKESKLKKKAKESSKEKSKDKSKSKQKHHKRSKSKESSRSKESHNKEEDHDFYASYKEELKKKKRIGDHLRQYHDASFEEEEQERHLEYEDHPKRIKISFDTFEEPRLYSRDAPRDLYHPANFLLGVNRKFPDAHPDDRSYRDVQRSLQAMTYSDEREKYRPNNDSRFREERHDRFNHMEARNSSNFQRRFGRNERTEEEIRKEGKANWEKYKRQTLGKNFNPKDTFHDDLIRSLDEPDCRRSWKEWKDFKKEKQWPPPIDSNFISNGFKDEKDPEDERIIKGTAKPLSITNLLGKEPPSQTITSVPSDDKEGVVEKQENGKSIATVAPIPRASRFEQETPVVPDTLDTTQKEENPTSCSVPKLTPETIKDLTKLDLELIIAKQLKEIRQTVGSTNEKILETQISSNATENDFYFDGKHPVSALMEYCSKNRHPPPNFQLCNDEGPPHSRRFIFKVEVNGVEYEPTISAQTKKLAKAYAAAFSMKSIIANLPPPAPSPPKKEIRNKKRVGAGRLDSSWKSSLNRLMKNARSSNANPNNDKESKESGYPSNYNSYYNY